MKLLNGSDLAGFIKERQAKQVRGLVQAHNVQPKLAIVQAKDDPVINTYVNLKKRYGADIGIEVDIHRVDQNQVKDLLTKLNEDPSVHGIIVQLPLSDVSETDEVLNLVSSSKDVDGLAKNTEFDPATPTAILWLINGFNVDLRGKKILIVGHGALVGAPLTRMLREMELDVEVADKDSDLTSVVPLADVVITATGKPGLITSEMITEQSVLVDAGVAVAEGKTVGDLADDVYERDDLTLTPKKGGVGPLTVCALFDNVIRAATKLAQASS